MVDSADSRTVEKLLRQQAALAAFGTFAFRESHLPAILTEAARICAASLSVAFCKICRYRAGEDDLLIEAGCGWNLGVVGRVVSQANESSPQGRAYVTGEPVIIHNLNEANNLNLPAFYAEHGILSTVDVLIPGIDGAPYGVLEVDSPTEHQYDRHDINFLTGFANVVAEAVATATKNSRLRALLAEKDLLAEELQHRVRNNLQMVSLMLASYARTAADDSLRQSIGAIVGRVTALAKVYDSLLGVGLSHTIDLGSYLGDLCASLPELYGKPAQPVELIYQSEPIQLGLDSVTALGMAVAELVTNSYGHAFPDRAGTITVTLARLPGVASAQLTVRDDGVGFAAGAGSTRHGMSLVKRLMAQVSGSFEVESVAGTCWTLIFPVPPVALGVREAA